MCSQLQVRYKTISFVQYAEKYTLTQKNFKKQLLLIFRFEMIRILITDKPLQGHVL